MELGRERDLNEAFLLLDSKVMMKGVYENCLGFLRDDLQEFTVLENYLHIL